MKMLLLAGGISNEREVSLASGRAVYEALKRLGHTVFVIDTANGKSLLTNDGKFIDAGSSNGQPSAALRRTSPMTLAKSIASPAFRDIDVVFLALHGGRGENGSIQNLLSMSGKAYTGSNMEASAIAMNKSISKRLYTSVGIGTPQWELCRIRNGEVDYETINKIDGKFNYPLIVKPNDGGSTLGLSKVDDVSQLRPAILKAAEETQFVLVETFISGREMTVSVFDGKAFPVVEIVPVSGLYDYEAKYTKGKSEYIAPAEISAELAKGLQEAAEKAYDVTGAEGLARVDFILDDNNEFHCLEVNTLPGMTELSLAPMAAKAAGVEFDELVQKQIDLALKGHSH
jgi:D-alanine-D-alanine ligase